jgi:hypothetical protein
VACMASFLFSNAWEDWSVPVRLPAEISLAPNAKFCAA